VTSNKEATKAYGCDQSDLDYLKAEQERLETSLDLLLENLLIRNNQRSAGHVNTAVMHRNFHSAASHQIY
jgi:hypothetical protein